MRKLYPLFLIALLFGASCSEKVTGEVEQPQGISFKTAIDSRVAGNVFEEGDLISVSAFEDESFTTLFADNAQYKFQGGKFVSDNSIVYNKFDSDNGLAFCALYPAQSEFDMEMQMSVYADQSDGDNYTLSDVMVARTALVSDAEPLLTFSRIFSQIVVDVRNENGDVVDNASVSVYAIASADVDFTSSEVIANGEVEKITAADNGNGSYKVIVPAQTLTDGDVFVEVVESDGTITEKVLKSDFVLESGDSYNVDVTLKEEAAEPEKYAEGDVKQWQAETAGAPKPVHLVFVGDGYIEEDYEFGGTFDKDVEAAINAFFAIEPYATYKEYFRISTVAAYSEDRGATIKEEMPYDNLPAQNKNTTFSSVLEGGTTTGVSCDYDKVFEYAKKVPGVDETELEGTTVILLINLDAYAGTCMMEAYGRSVSMCPVGSAFGSIVQHEAGGHGFGRLLDEYRYYNTSMPSNDVDAVKIWRNVDSYYGYNIDIQGYKSLTHWKDYFSREGYEAVGFYEGACLYYQGAWRAETISCMEDNRAYHSAPSREAIVRRICRTSGLIFDIDSFIANDKVKSDPTKAAQRAIGDMSFRPLGKPILRN